MNKLQKELYNSLTRIAREEGIEISEGKKYSELTAEQRRQIEQTHQDVSNFLRNYHRFEKNPENLELWLDIRQHEIIIPKLFSWIFEKNLYISFIIILHG